MAKTKLKWYSKEERLFEEEYYRSMAEQYAREYWGVELTCPIEFVNRDWRSLRGSFRINYETDECRIVMSHKVNQRMGTGPTLETLKHELVHWYLWSIGEPFDDDDPRFISECLRIGASISGTKKAQTAYKKFCAEMEAGD